MVGLLGQPVVRNGDASPRYSKRSIGCLWMSQRGEIAGRWARLISCSLRRATRTLWHSPCLRLCTEIWGFLYETTRPTRLRHGSLADTVSLGELLESLGHPPPASKMVTEAFSLDFKVAASLSVRGRNGAEVRWKVPARARAHPASQARSWTSRRCYARPRWSKHRLL